MIRINDHLIRADIITRVQIFLHDGAYYVLVVLEGDNNVVPLAMPDRANAEAALEKIQRELMDYYGDWEGGIV